MTVLDWIMVVPEFIFAAGIAVFIIALAVWGAVTFWRWARFRLGRVPADGAPLDKREAMALVSVRRGYRMPSHPDQPYQRQEDWQ